MLNNMEVSKIKLFLKHCYSRSNLFRSFVISIIVGTLLVLINYSKYIFHENLTVDMILPMSMNYVIPFFVSKVASTIQIAKYEK